MKFSSRSYLVSGNKPVRLDQIPTKIEPFYKTKEDYQDMLARQVEQTAHRQAALYAQNRYSLLLIFQAMDTAGKDGAIKHVLSGVDPAGCQVHSFKTPNAEELDHDFLWRACRVLPERGRIGVFNRSYYEEVLIVRVHPEFLEKQNLPDESVDKDNIWEERFESIRALEKHLYRNGTRILKFFLHLSKDEQARRLLKRIDDVEKNWKANPADVGERKYWNDYMRAYEDCLTQTSRKEAPWYIIPADDKRNARLIISRVIVETLQRLPLEFPKPTRRHLDDLKTMRLSLERELRSR